MKRKSPSKSIHFIPSKQQNEMNAEEFDEREIYFRNFIILQYKKYQTDLENYEGNVRVWFEEFADNLKEYFKDFYTPDKYFNNKLEAYGYACDWCDSDNDNVEEAVDYMIDKVMEVVGYSEFYLK